MNIELKEVIKQVLLTSHPVGSLFFTKDNRNPDEILFGGGGVTKWKQIEGRFIYGASASHPIGQTGGEESHQLTESEMPNHTHQGFYWAKEEPGWEIDLNVGTVGYGLTWQGVGGSLTEGKGAGDPLKCLRVAKTGGSQPHNNLPPFAVYAIWERIE